MHLYVRINEIANLLSPAMRGKGTWKCHPSTFSTLFFVMLLPNKFVFVMWPYYEQLQIKFEFGYGGMIFMEVVALGLRKKFH